LYNVAPVTAFQFTVMDDDDCAIAVTPVGASGTTMAGANVVVVAVLEKADSPAESAAFTL
jgi:hypothetical protein